MSILKEFRTFAMRGEAPAPPPEPSPEVKLLTEIRDALQRR